MKLMAHDIPDASWPRIARRNGIQCSTYHRRIDAYGWSKRDAATTPPLTPQQARQRRGGAA